MYTIAEIRIDWLRKHAKITQKPMSSLPKTCSMNEESSLHIAHSTRNSKALKITWDPQEQLQVLTLMYFQGKSGQEVADELSIPLGTVKSRVRLALQS